MIFAHDDGSWAGWIMAGGQAVAYRNWFGAGTGQVVVGSEDFDGDGRDDLLWRGPDGTYSVWLMAGLNPKAYRMIQPGGAGWEVVAP